MKAGTVNIILGVILALLIVVGWFIDHKNNKAYQQFQDAKDIEIAKYKFQRDSIDQERELIAKERTKQDSVISAQDSVVAASVVRETEIKRRYEKVYSTILIESRSERNSAVSEGLQSIHLPR